MKVVFYFMLFVLQIQKGFKQDSIQNEQLAAIARIDSIIASTEKEILTEKMIVGSAKPIFNYRGTAFLNSDRTEIRKVKLTIEATGESITYYCIKNSIQIIQTSQALYYRSNDKYFAFHAISNKGLFTEEELLMQDDMMKNYTKLLLGE